MKTQQHYYLIGKDIKKGTEMPESKKWKGFLYETFEDYYNALVRGLQSCEISEIELDKIIEYLLKGKSSLFLDASNPIDVTDIIDEVNCLNGCCTILKFKQPKQVESDAVDDMFNDFNMEYYSKLIYKGEQNQFSSFAKWFKNQNKYEIFKNRK